MKINRKQAILSAIFAAGMMATSAAALTSCQTKPNASQTDSAQADSAEAGSAAENSKEGAQASQEESVLAPQQKESGDTRFLIFPDYRGKTWTIRDNGEDVKLESDEKAIDLKSVSIPASDMARQLFNVVDARIYNGKIWIIGYGDYGAGMVADHLGTLVVYYDIASGKFGYVKNCHDARFEGKAIKYDEQVLKKRGASRAEDEYADNWKTYQMD